MKTLLLVGAGPLQLPAFHAARARGLRVVAIDRDPAAPGMALADVARAVDTRDLEGALALARAERVDGALTLCTDAPVRTVAAVCSALGLPGLDPQVALRCTHKGHMRDALARRGAPVPRYRRTFDLEEARAALDEVGLPAVIKPVGASGSQGVYQLQRADEIEVAYAHALTASRGATEVLVEEFVDGPEVSVETLSYGGQHHLVAITDKRTTGTPHWVEVGHVQPSRLPRVAQTQLKVATLAALDALGVMQSAGHVELRVGRKGPRVVEVGARLGGDYITTELVPRSTGIDMVGAAIDLALGQTPRVKTTLYAAAAVRYVEARPGKVVAVTGIDEARRMPGVVAVELFVHEGDAVRPVRASQDRAGYVIAEAEDPTEAETRAEAATAAVRVETGQEAP